MMERIVHANGVDLCTEAFGDPADPPILLVMGTGASMVWWEDDFCRMLAERRRYVIRYDHRDTGRSATYEPGRPGYTGADLCDDAAGVLEALAIPEAHVVGLSAGGGIAQELALSHAERVLSLTIISCSPAVPGHRPLPAPTEPFMRFVAGVEVDWSDRASVTEYLVGYSRVLAGEERPFDEDAARDLVVRDLERARDFAAAQNHDLMRHEPRTLEPLSSIGVATLVIHGTADPMFPPAHGEALASEIPGARLMALDGAGHGLYRADWDSVAEAIAAHTADGATG
jgi:pimeloyl-ACP methyl ester carboxylesterase